MIYGDFFWAAIQTLIILAFTKWKPFWYIVYFLGMLLIYWIEKII